MNENKAQTETERLTLASHFPSLRSASKKLILFFHLFTPAYSFFILLIRVHRFTYAATLPSAVHLLKHANFPPKYLEENLFVYE